MRNKKQKKSSNKKRLSLNVIDIDKQTFQDFAESVDRPWRVFFLGFLRGAGLGLGTLIGGAILLALITYIVSILSAIPIVGDFIKSIVDRIATNMK